MRKQMVLISLGVLFIVLGLASRASAQATTAAVVGIVTDSSGAAIVGAKVTIKNVETQVARGAESNDSGSYVFDILPPGAYEITVEMASFQTSRVNLTLVAAQRAQVDVTLKVGQSNQTVEVQSNSAALQTQNATVGSVMEEKSVQDLPLNGRNLFSLVQTTPGVNQGPGGGVQTGTRPDDRRQTTSVSANGQNEAFNNNMIDGMDNNEMQQGGILLRPSVEAISEIVVHTNSYSADVGRSEGAVINVITKSGTNSFHGSVYEYLRNDKLDANDFFSNAAGLPRAEYRQNQYGASLGGPIRKDKTFFFVDFEQYRIVQAQATGLLTVPTLFEEQNPGNFSDIGGPVIPTTQIDPVALKYFQLYPAPNVPGAGAVNNYAATPKYTQNSTTVDARIDQHFNVNNSLFVRYSWNPVSTFTPGAFPAVDGIQGGGVNSYPGPSNATGQGIQSNYLHVFRPNLMMELRAGFSRVNIQSLPLNFGTNAADKFGMPNADFDHLNSGLPPVTISGYAPLGDATFVPIIDVNNVFQSSGVVSYTRSKHEISFGAGVIRRQMNYYQSPYGGGQFNFNGSATDALATFLQGVPTFISRQTPLDTNYMRVWEPSVFVQDNWRVKPWLTLNLGGRWDYFSPVTNAKNQRSNVDLETGQLILASGSDPSAGVRPDHKDFAPRFGFAISPGHDLAIRGAFGMSYFPSDYSGSATNLVNPPFVYLFNCQPGSTVQGLICPAGVGTLSQGPPIPTTQSTAPADLTGGLSGLPFYNPASYIEQFNLTVEKQFGASLISASYIGELGRRLSWWVNVDVPTPSTNPNPTLPYATVFPNVSGIFIPLKIGGSAYNAAQFEYEYKARHGFNLRASYTFANNLSNVQDSGTWLSTLGLIINNQRYDWGNAENAVRHAFNMTASYELPFGKSSAGFKRMAIAGWQLNAIAFYDSGIPYTVMDCAFATAPSNIPGVSCDRPNVVGPFNPTHQNINTWFNASAFAAQPFGSAGNEGRNQLWGPSNRELDMSVFKEFPIKEALRLQFRAECYNLTNTANFANPNSTIFEFDSAGVPTQAGGFGQVTSTRIGSIPREFQFALKLLF